MFHYYVSKCANLFIVIGTMLALCNFKCNAQNSVDVPRRALFQKDSEQGGCQVPSTKNLNFYIPSGTWYEPIPSGLIAKRGTSIFFGCYQGSLGVWYNSSSCSTGGDWFPEFPTDCLEACKNTEQCPQGSLCLNNQCLPKAFQPCRGECGTDEHCTTNLTLSNGDYIVKNFCTLSSTCPPLKSENMEVKCQFQDREMTCTISMMPGTIATPKCDYGFTPDEEPEYSQLSCLPSGQWDHPLFNCILDRRALPLSGVNYEELCQPLPYKSRNVKVRCEYLGNQVSCDKIMDPGTIAVSTCKDSHSLSPRKKVTQSTCLPTGQWDAPLINCIPVCGKSTEIGKPLFKAITTRIIDGREAKPGTFPWHAGIYFRQGESWEQRCGGSLISDQFILTAGHCVYRVEDVDVRIALGKYHRSWNQIEDHEQKRNISKVIYHPDYHRDTLYFDLALLKLDKKVEVGQFVMPVCSRFLHRSEDSLVNKTLYVAGWGQTQDVPSESESENLLFNELILLPKSICRRIIPEPIHLFDKFCTAKSRDTAVSIVQAGDSGGGLTAVFEEVHYIFGVVSHKIKQISTFTNLTWSAHVRWIENEIRKYDNSYQWS